MNWRPAVGSTIGESLLSDDEFISFVERMDRCWMQGGLQDLDAFLAEDVVFVAPGGKRRGEGIAQAIEGYRQFTSHARIDEKPLRLTDRQALQVAAYINSLDPSVPAVPTPNLKGADVADGADLFSLNCAACHTITGAGDALAFGTNAPSLQDKQVTAQQVAEALRIGPANMPRFSGNLTDNQVRDVVAYVTEK